MNPISIKHTLRLCGLAVLMSAAGLLTAHAQTTTLGTRSTGNCRPTRRKACTAGLPINRAMLGWRQLRWRWEDVTLRPDRVVRQVRDVVRAGLLAPR